MPAASRRSTSSRDCAHRIGDGVAQSGGRASMAFGAGTAGAQFSIAPHTYSPNDAGALSAYVLHPNEMLDYNFVADRNRMPRVAPPKRGIVVWRGSKSSRQRKVENLARRAAGPRDDMRST